MEKYTGPERRNKAATSNQQIKTDATGLIIRSIREGIPIEDLRMREPKDSLEYELLIIAALGLTKKAVSTAMQARNTETGFTEDYESKRRNIISQQYQAMQNEAFNRAKVGDPVIDVNKLALYLVTEILNFRNRKKLKIKANFPDKSCPELPRELIIEDSDLVEDILVMPDGSTEKGHFDPVFCEQGQKVAERYKGGRLHPAAEVLKVTESTGSTLTKSIGKSKNPNHTCANCPGSYRPMTPFEIAEYEADPENPRYNDNR